MSLDVYNDKFTCSIGGGGTGDFTEDSTSIKDFWIALTALFSLVSNGLSWLPVFGTIGSGSLVVSKTLKKLFNDDELSVTITKMYT